MPGQLVIQAETPPSSVKLRSKTATRLWNKREILVGEIELLLALVMVVVLL